MSDTRKKTTVYVDAELLRAVKALAASTNRHDYEVIEEALSQYVALATTEARNQAMRHLLDELAEDSAETLDDDEALMLAYSELSAMRNDRHRSG